MIYQGFIACKILVEANEVMLTASDISLWLAVTAIVFLMTSELLYSSPEYSMRLRIEKKRLRLVAVG